MTCGWQVFKELKSGRLSQTDVHGRLDGLRKATDVFYNTLMDQEMNLVEQNEVRRPLTYNKNHTVLSYLSHLQRDYVYIQRNYVSTARQN